MASPFKKPNIDYKPQIAEAIDVPIPPEGEEGIRQTAADVSEVLGMLIDEVKTVTDEVESSLSQLAISDGNGVLTSMVQTVLSTQKPPTSVSYNTYSALGNRSDAAAIRAVFEDKAYSVWGDASIAFVDSLSLVAMEAVRAKAFLDSGVVDEKVISSIEKWVGAARSFIVDVSRITSSTITEDLRNEASVYADNAIDVQKSAIIGASVIANEIRGNISRMKQMYSSGNVYDSVIDNGPSIKPVTTGVVASLLDLHVDLAQNVKDDLSSDLDYRTEAFSESASGLIAAVSKLKATQMINSEISGYGVSELDVDDVVTTKPDESYDQKVISQVKKAESLPEGSSISLSRVLKSISESVDPTISSISGQMTGIQSDIAELQSTVSTVMSWHTKAIHDTLQIDASTLDGHAASDFSESGHSHTSLNLLKATVEVEAESTINGTTSGAANFSSHGAFSFSVGANSTVTVSNLTAGQRGSITFNPQGAYTITWSGQSIKWIGAAFPTLVSGKLTVVTLFHDGTRVIGSWGSEV